MSAPVYEFGAASVEDWVQEIGHLALVAGAVGLATYILARLVQALPGRYLCDPSASAPAAERARKYQTRPVPLVGGMALVLGVWLAGSATSDAGFEVLGLIWPGAIASGLALCLAFAVGWIDDLRPSGLSPLAKFLGQCTAGLPLGYGIWLRSAETLGDSPLVCVGLLLLAALAAAVAQNAINTFDNANGAATGVSALAMALCSPAAAGALLGFLPFNMRRVQRSGSLSDPTPGAYLGDSGSHLLGMWILLTPLAWPVLTLPLLDLARLSVERVRRGSLPWRGDRRHLAHLFIARGYGAGVVLSALVAVAAPSIVLGAIGIGAQRIELLIVGIAATAFSYSVSFYVLRASKASSARRLAPKLIARSETTRSS